MAIERKPLRQLSLSDSPAATDNASLFRDTRRSRGLFGGARPEVRAFLPSDTSSKITLPAETSVDKVSVADGNILPAKKEPQKPPSEAYIFVAKYIGDPVHVERLMSPDKNIAATAFNDVARNARAMKPRVEYGALDPARPDARLEAAARILRGLAQEEDPKKRKLGIKLLPELQLTASHAKPIRDQLVRAAESAAKTEASGTIGVVRDLVDASHALAPSLPRDLASQKIIMDSLKNALDLGNTSGVPRNIIDAKIKALGIKITPSKPNVYMTEQQRAARNSKAIELASTTDLRVEEIADLVGSSPRTLYSVLQGVQKDKKMPPITSEQQDAVAEYKVSAEKIEPGRRTLANQEAVAARKKAEDILVGFTPQQQAEILGVNLRIVLNDKRKNRPDAKRENRNVEQNMSQIYNAILTQPSVPPWEIADKVDGMSLGVVKTYLPKLEASGQIRREKVVRDGINMFVYTAIDSESDSLSTAATGEVDLLYSRGSDRISIYNTPKTKPS